MTTNHLILDFSHVYSDENIPKNTGIHWLDCSEIEECDLYCSRQAEEKIREKIKPYGIHGIHFLDSGNYHYVTEIMTSQIQKEFQLVVFDHHTDMQKPMIEHMTSCGDWAEKVLETNPWLQQLVLIGPQAKDIEQLYRENDGLMNRKEISEKLRNMYTEYSKREFKEPEKIKFPKKELEVEANSSMIVKAYTKVIEKNKKRLNKNAKNIQKIAITDQYTVSSKVKEMYKELVKNNKFVFNNLFSQNKCNKVEVVTAFTGLLEMSRRSKVQTSQAALFGDILVEKNKPVKDNYIQNEE